MSYDGRRKQRSAEFGTLRTILSRKMSKYKETAKSSGCVIHAVQRPRSHSGRCHLFENTLEQVGLVEGLFSPPD